jgi:hypothetical protein
MNWVRCWAGHRGNSEYHSEAMGKFVGVVFIVFVVVALFAMAGDLFPEGSFLNDMGARDSQYGW